LPSLYKSADRQTLFMLNNGLCEAGSPFII